jgi:hypothetical protein
VKAPIGQPDRLYFVGKILGIPAMLDLRDAIALAEQPDEADDQTAEVIAGLSDREADLLWAALIQLKPHLRD